MTGQPNTTHAPEWRALDGSEKTDAEYEAILRGNAAKPRWIFGVHDVRFLLRKLEEARNV